VPRILHDLAEYVDRNPLRNPVLSIVIGRIFFGVPCDIGKVMVCFRGAGQKNHHEGTNKDNATDRCKKAFGHSISPPVFNGVSDVLVEGLLLVSEYVLKQGDLQKIFGT